MMRLFYLLPLITLSFAAGGDESEQILFCQTAPGQLHAGIYGGACNNAVASLLGLLSDLAASSGADNVSDVKFFNRDKAMNWTNNCNGH